MSVRAWIAVAALLLAAPAARAEDAGAEAALQAEGILVIEAVPVEGGAPAAPAAAPAPEAAEPVPEAAPVAEGAPAPAAGDVAPAASDARFFSELAYKDVATAADAARALVIFVSLGSRPGGDFVADKRYLRGQGATSRWLEGAAESDPLDKGHLAECLCRALDIQGGLWMRLFGPVPRYALRECVYLELMVQGAEYQHVSGGELVGVIDRADRWRLKQAGSGVPELTGEPSGAAGPEAAE